MQKPFPDGLGSGMGVGVAGVGEKLGPIGVGEDGGVAPVGAVGPVGPPDGVELLQAARSDEQITTTIARFIRWMLSRVSQRGGIIGP